MPAAYVYPTLDDEPLVPITTSNNHKDNAGTITTAMDPAITTTTLRRKDIPLAEDDKEELELDSLNNKDRDNDTPDQPATLRKEDLGNFILLVILCKPIVSQSQIIN